jgi:hypothetical protein
MWLEWRHEIEGNREENGVYFLPILASKGLEVEVNPLHVDFCIRVERR